MARPVYASRPDPETAISYAFQHLPSTPAGEAFAVPEGIRWTGCRGTVYTVFAGFGGMSPGNRGRRRVARAAEKSPPGPRLAAAAGARVFKRPAR